MTQHDRLFKELLRTFFLEFLQLFAPDLAAKLRPQDIAFIDREHFSHLRLGSTLEPDVVARVLWRGEPTEILIHVEHQAQPQADFARRMFRYFARLHEAHTVPILPIAVFSHDAVRPESNSYQVGLPSRPVLHFQFQTIQLRQIPWRKYLRSHNPVAAALMARMKFLPVERPRVKLECLRVLLRARPDPTRLRLLSGFIDTYLPLDPAEALQFEQAADNLLPSEEKAQVMELTTSWKEEGRAEGLQTGLSRGRREGRREGRKSALTSVVERQLLHQFPSLPSTNLARLQSLPASVLNQLAIDLLKFRSPKDLDTWMRRRSRR